MSQQEGLSLTPPDGAEVVPWVASVLSPAVCLENVSRGIPSASTRAACWWEVVAACGTSLLRASIFSVRWEARSLAGSDDGEGGVGVWRIEEKIGRVENGG